MTVKDLRTLVDNLDEYIHVPGGIERLKKTVLHLAVSGQLVPQDPTEGTGEDLYKQIQAIHNPKKPIPDVKDVPFDIPNSWKWVKLGNIIELKSGADLTPDKYNDSKNGIPYITGASNIENEKVIVSRWTTAPKNIAKENDLLITCKGTIGTMAYLEFEQAHIARQIMAIRFNEMLSPSFIKSVVSTHISALQEAAQSIIPGIARNDMLNLLVPLPSLLEQNRIVERLSDIFTLIDELDAEYKTEEVARVNLVKSSLRALSHNDATLALENLTQIIRTKADAAELRKAILHLAVSGQLVPQNPAEGTGEELYKQIQSEKQKLIAQGKLKKQNPLPEITEEEIPFKIPKSWKWARLGDISDIFNGNSINAAEKIHKYAKINEGYPYLATKDIGYGFEIVNYENGVKVPFDENDFKIINPGTVLICSEGGSAGKKCAIIQKTVTFGNKMYAFKAFDEAILPDFVLYNYLTSLFFKQFQQKMTGIIGGISIANFKELLLPVPPLAEQTRIVQKTTQLLDLVSKLEKHLEK